MRVHPSLPNPEWSLTATTCHPGPTLCFLHAQTQGPGGGHSLLALSLSWSLPPTHLLSPAPLSRSPSQAPFPLAPSSFSISFSPFLCCSCSLPSVHRQTGPGGSARPLSTQALTSAQFARPPAWSCPGTISHRLAPLIRDCFLWLPGKGSALSASNSRGLAQWADHVASVALSRPLCVWQGPPQAGLGPEEAGGPKELTSSPKTHLGRHCVPAQGGWVYGAGCGWDPLTWSCLGLGDMLQQRKEGIPGWGHSRSPQQPAQTTLLPCSKPSTAMESIPGSSPLPTSPADTALHSQLPPGLTPLPAEPSACPRPPQLWDGPS